MLLSNTGVLPGESPAYTFLMGDGVYFGIALILLNVDLRSVLKAGPGALGTLFPTLPEVLWLTTLVLVLAQIPAGTALPGGALFDNYLILLFLASNGARSVIATLAVASQANVGGAASAIAIAGARGYSDRLVPGVAVDLLGYALGNHLGLAVGLLMRGVLGA